MKEFGNRPVISGARFFLAHAPGLVRYGSKPCREIVKNSISIGTIKSHLRSYEQAAVYLPNQVFLGNRSIDELDQTERPWFARGCPGKRWGPYGELMPGEEFYGLLKIADDFQLVQIEKSYSRRLSEALARHPFIRAADLKGFDEGVSLSQIKATVTEGSALPLELCDGTVVGCVLSAHDEDASLTAEVMLENLASKACASMALRTLLHGERHDADSLQYVINTGEEAVGDRYQRGGGNLAKAIAEACGCNLATGVDVKGFCCGPIHGLMIAASLVQSDIFRKVAVVGGCSVAKLGMKFLGHLKKDMPILEDVLAGMAIMVERNDGLSPMVCLESVGRHTVSANSQQAIFQELIKEPLKRLKLSFRQIDKYATELHNPEVTEPAGSGDVPKLNYRTIAALAVLAREIDRSEIAEFVKTHGMVGFSPTQGHIASAVPFMSRAIESIRSGEMDRVMFVAKGSLFLGRMTHLADGMSFILEKNPET